MAATITFLLMRVEVAASRNDAARIAERRGGTLARERGDRDALVAAFTDPSDAVGAALAIQLNESARGEAGPLSARELEVAQLLPTGLTNRRIAERLVLSVRTVDAHVEHIRNKLGVRTRAEIATWVTAQTLEKREPAVACALHTGQADVHEDTYGGRALDRCVRLLEIAHAGQVLVSATTVALLSERLPVDITLRDMGRHQLTDLLEPEHVFQLCHADLADDFPPLRSLDVRPTNLPSHVASFIGREMELAEVGKLVESRRLVTLTGTAGVGKTSLALHVAANLLDAFPDGVWLAELAPVADPGLVLTELASAVRLGEDASATRPIEDRLVDHLRPRCALIVLDNCEHVVTECARVVDRVLRACPEISILATSREPLGVAGESVWRVPSLSVPDAGTPAEALAEFDAARLFVDRAERASSQFGVTTDNAAGIAETCARLDGIPLAIELAAARTTLFTPRQIADRLDDRFRLLTGGARTAVERQQTMRAALDWSYDLLDEAEKLLLDRLSIFAGGCTFEAAEAVCSGPGIQPGDVLDLLGSLVHKSLVIREENGEAARFGLLETIKQYAGEKLAARGETSEVTDRHFRYYASFFEANDVHNHPLGPRSTAEEIDRLEREYDNLLAALGRTRSSADALRLSRVCGFWNATRRFHVSVPLIERNLAAPDASPALRAGALTSLGWAAFVTDDHDTAATRLEESLTLTRELGVEASREFCVFRDLSPLLDTIFGLFLVRLWRGEVDRLPSLAEEAMTIARRSQDTVELRVANIISGIAALAQLNIAGAREAFDEEIGLARSAGRPPSDMTLLILGQLDLLSGDFDKAEASLVEGLEIATGPGTPLFFGPQLRGALAAVARHRGDIRGARAHLEAAVDSDDFFMPHQRMVLLPQLTQVLVEDAEDASALDRIAERLDEFADSFPYAGRLFSATQALIEGRFADSDRFAREAFDHALPNFPESGERPFSVWRDLQRGIVRAMRGEVDETDAAAIQDWLTRARLPAPLWQAAQSTYLLESGDVDGARSVLDMLVRGRFVASLWDENRQAAICMMAVTAARLGDADRADVLYGYLLPNAGHLVASAGAATCVGAADRYLGMLAATMGRLDKADLHLEAALALETALGAKALVALTRLEYARVLDARGDRERASEMLEAALTMARELGMHKLERDALELLSSLTQQSPGEDRRVARTFLFSDIVRSTNLVDAIGDEAWADLLTWHDEILRKLFVEHGGQEVAHTGDGFFVAFEKADDALACAVAIQRSLVKHRRTHGFSPRVRIGLHATEAAEVRGNYHGRGVHEAARIGAAAEAGEILVSTSTLASIKAEMASAEERAVTLKGVAEPITVASVVWRND